MDKNFEIAAKNWIEQYSADIMEKVENLLNENDSTPEELANVIGVDTEEIYDILDGNGENISIETLIKVFMVLGFAIEIKPIEETPLGSYDNVNPHVMHEPQHEERREPQPSPFNCPPMGMPIPPHNPYGMQMPPRGFDPRNMPPHIREKVERDLGIRDREPQARPQRPFVRRERPQEEETPTSPFALMGREELVKIINKHLWDSEIDTENAPKLALVRFLEEKDKRMQAAKRRESEEKEIKELENDPKVANFINKMKSTYKKNPQFRSYVKNFLGNLEEE
jgi:predicted XRE-type DNA-binding protein